MSLKNKLSISNWTKWSKCRQPCKKLSEKLVLFALIVDEELDIGNIHDVIHPISSNFRDLNKFNQDLLTMSNEDS